MTRFLVTRFPVTRFPVTRFVVTRLIRPQHLKECGRYERVCTTQPPWKLQ